MGPNMLSGDIAKLERSILNEEQLYIPKSKSLKPLYRAIYQRQQIYDQQIKSMKTAADQRDTFKSDIQQIRAQHHMAEEIQRGMLPDMTEIAGNGRLFDVFADMDTAWEIGGDFYDCFLLDDHRLFVLIADVSGKSVSAAMFSMAAMTAIRISLLDGKHLDETACAVSRYLYGTQHERGHMFVTAWMGILDIANGQISYINAGHEPPIYVGNSGSVHFCDERSGIPFASYFSKRRPELNQYQERTMKMDKGDFLILYTDGLSECMNSSGIRFGKERILKSIEKYEITEKTVPEEIVRYLQRRAMEFADHAQQDDDITILAMKRM